MFARQTYENKMLIVLRNGDDEAKKKKADEQWERIKQEDPRVVYESTPHKIDTARKVYGYFKGPDYETGGVITLGQKRNIMAKTAKDNGCDVISHFDDDDFYVLPGVGISGRHTFISSHHVYICLYHVIYHRVSRWVS